MPTKEELLAQQKLINDQLNFIENEEKEALRLIRVERENRIYKALMSMTMEQRFAVVDLLAPEHGRTSCSDGNPNNDWDSATGGRNAPRCNRCAMLQTITKDFSAPYGAVIQLDLRYNAD